MKMNNNWLQLISIWLGSFREEVAKIWIFQLLMSHLFSSSCDNNRLLKAYIYTYQDICMTRLHIHITEYLTNYCQSSWTDKDKSLSGVMEAHCRIIGPNNTFDNKCT